MRRADRKADVAFLQRDGVVGQKARVTGRQFLDCHCPAPQRRRLIARSTRWYGVTGTYMPALIGGYIEGLTRLCREARATLRLMLCVVVTRFCAGMPQ